MFSSLLDAPIEDSAPGARAPAFKPKVKPRLRKGAAHSLRTETKEATAHESESGIPEKVAPNPTKNSETPTTQTENARKRPVQEATPAVAADPCFVDQPLPPSEFQPSTIGSVQENPAPVVEDGGYMDFFAASPAAEALHPQQEAILPGRNQFAGAGLERQKRRNAAAVDPPVQASFLAATDSSPRIPHGTKRRRRLREVTGEMREAEASALSLRNLIRRTEVLENERKREAKKLGSPLPGKPPEENSASLSRDRNEKQQQFGIAPQYKMIGGKAVLDYSSLEISADKTAKESAIQFTRMDKDNAPLLNSRSYARWQKPKRWTEEETDKFYNALRLFGSDFLLIEQHFNRDENGNPTLNKRTRNELKRKYDKENKTNPGRVDEALESMERGEDHSHYHKLSQHLSKERAEKGLSVPSSQAPPQPTEEEFLVEKEELSQSQSAAPDNAGTASIKDGGEFDYDEEVEGEELNEAPAESEYPYDYGAMDMDSYQYD